MAAAGIWLQNSGIDMYPHLHHALRYCMRSFGKAFLSSHTSIDNKRQKLGKLEYKKRNHHASDILLE